MKPSFVAWCGRSIQPWRTRVSDARRCMTIRLRLFVFCFSARRGLVVGKRFCALFLRRLRLSSVGAVFTSAFPRLCWCPSADWRTSVRPQAARGAKYDVNLQNQLENRESRTRSVLCNTLLVLGAPRPLRTTFATNGVHIPSL